MEKIIVLCLLFITSLSHAQVSSISLPKTDYDSLSCDQIELHLDTLNDEFAILIAGNDRESGFIFQYEFHGKLTDIDSVHFSSDKNNKACGLRLYSCEKTSKKQLSA